MGKKLRGVIPAIITPIDDYGKIDIPMLTKQCTYLSSAGVSGLLIAGTTGEGAYLNTDQKITVFETVKEASGGGQFICLAVLQPSTPQVLNEINALDNCNPDYLVAVTPYYGKADQSTIAEHFTDIAHASTAPLILYNIPSATHNPATVETVLELAQNKKIQGIKDSSGDFTFFARGFLSDFPEDFTWIIGNDLLDASALLLGCRCIVTGLGNVRIEPYIEMLRAAEAENTEKVKNCQKYINLLFHIISSLPSEKSIAAVKAGAAYYGRSKRRMLMPAMGLSEEETSRVENILEQIEQGKENE